MMQKETATRASLFDPCRFDPKVSICVMSYNHGAFIQQAMESVLSQEASFPFEIVIVNAGSSDGTGRILDQLRKDHLEIRILHQLKIGHSKSVRKGYEAARGDYIAQVDANGRSIKNAR